ncbi:unnamed protein product [Prunus armeniaca]
METEHLISHKHPLMFKEEQKEKHGGLAFCSGCAEPVIGPGYCCTKYPECDFIVHKLLNFL